MFRHAFSPTGFNGGYVTLSFHDGVPQPLTWSTIAERDKAHPLWFAMSHSSAWLDYARLRRIYEMQPETMLQNLFPLCRELLLAEVPLPARTETFQEEWNGIERQFGQRRSPGWSGQEQMRRLRERVDAYNTSLRAFLPEWQTAVNKLLADFTDLTELSLSLENAAKIAWSQNWWVLGTTDYSIVLNISRSHSN